jgi:hypothetical protein
MASQPPLMLPESLPIDTMDTAKLAAALATPPACVRAIVACDARAHAPCQLR